MRIKHFQRELVQWARAILEAIPGVCGQYLRNRLYGYRCGSRVRVLKGVIINHPEKLVIGSYSGISPGTQINAGAGVEIGSGVLVGPNCIIWSVNHRFALLDVEIRSQGYDLKPVKIEDDVWIAAACIILPGVVLGKGAVVAAGAVVTKSVPPLSIVAGVPAKVIGVRGGAANA